MARKKMVFADITYELLDSNDVVTLATKVLREAIEHANEHWEVVVNIRETAHHNKNRVTVTERTDFMGRYF